MEKMRDILDLKHKKTLRMGLLLLSTIIILSASTLAYARVVYERALDVGNVSGVATGSGSTTSVGINLELATMVVLAVLALVIGLSVFVLLRKMPKHIRKTPGERGSSSTSPESASPGEEEWEESPRKGEGEE